MKVWRRIAGLIGSEATAALVSILSAKGSAPRGPGTRMVVSAGGAIAGTVGGGRLEHDLISRAVAQMGAGPAGMQVRHVLGPDLGQCCGGVVEASIEVFGAQDLPWIQPLAEAEEQCAEIETVGRADPSGRLVRRLADAGPDDAPGLAGVHERFGLSRAPVVVFGAGHVGRALVLALAPLPFAVDWVDERAEMFPAAAPAHVRMLCAADPAAHLTQVPDGALIVVMTHSHARDLEIVGAALAARRFGYVGLIGSASKRGRFLSRLAQMGLGAAAEALLVCPIGGGSIADKHPAVIAACVTVELLHRREKIAASAVCRGQN